MEEVGAPAQDVRATIEQINEERIGKTGQTWGKMDAEGAEFSKANGHEFIVLPKQEDERWGKLCLSVRYEYVEEMKQNGLSGEEALQFRLDLLSKKP